jgi:hypothetical protein
MDNVVRVNHTEIDNASICYFRRVTEAMKLHGGEVCILWKVTRYELGRKHRKLLSPPSPRLVNVDGYVFIPADLRFP